MLIKGDRVSLKPIEEGDIEWLRKVRNTYRDSFYTRDEITPQQQKAWYTRYQEGYTDEMFIIVSKSEFVGTIAIYNINLSDRSADIGRVIILEDFRGHGYMEEALNLLTSYAFKRLRLYRLRVSTYLDNAAAIGLYNKVGFESLSRPVMLMEMINPDKAVWDKPVNVEELS